MNVVRKYLSYIIFGLCVLLVVGLAVQRSRHLRSLVNDMASSNPAAQTAAATELIKGEQFMDSITGEPIPARLKAAESLELLGNKEAVKQCIAFLKDQDKPVRDRVVQALQKIGATSPDNIKELVAGLKDGDSYVRKGTIAALTDSQGGIGPKPGVVQAIVDIMKAEAGARGPGGDVLGSPLFEKSGADKESVPPLIALLKDKDEGVRSGAAEALGKIGDPAAVAPLQEAMHQDTAQVRRIAIGSIALIADPSGEADLIEAISNPDDDNEARAQAAAGLGKIASPKAVQTLVKALDDDDNKLRSAAVGALARAGRPTPDAPVQMAVLNSLTAALRDTRDSVRLGAAQALEVIAAPEANSALIPLLAKDTLEIRVAAAKALGFPGNSAAVAPLINALNDASGEVTEAASGALGEIGAAASDALVDALLKDGPVAYRAAQALAKQGANALPTLQKVAQGTSATGQRWAAVAMGDVGASGEEGIKAARPALEALEKSSDPDVAYVAKEQLDRLGRVQ